MEGDIPIWEKMRQKLITKEHRRFMQNVNAIHEEFQHTVVLAAIVMYKIRNVVRKTFAERRKIRLL